MTVQVLFNAYSSFARQLVTIKGRVVDDETGAPLPFASIFFNNTTFGAVADDDGNFKFIAKPGNYDLIVNFFSYQPIIYPIVITEEAPKKYLFKMSPLKYDLEEVSVESTRDKIWYRNYELFKSTFLGSSMNSQKCEILNPEVLIIDFNTKTRIMKVRARDILKIKNYGLGYEIDYLLDTYEYNVKLSRVYFQGYPKFLEMEGKAGKKSRWEKERKRAYLGSPTHFFASLVAKNTESEGFSMIEIIKKPNPNRPTEEEIKEAREKLRAARPVGVTISGNSEESNVLARSREPKFIQYTNNQPYGPDSMIRKDGNKIILDFDNYIQITYDREPSEIAFTGKIANKKVQTTSISLTKGPTEIMADGMLSDPLAILFDGYMGWEKLADMLPVDYKLPVGKDKNFK